MLEPWTALKLEKPADEIRRQQHAAGIGAPGHVIHIAGVSMPVMSFRLKLYTGIRLRCDRRIWRGLSNETDDTLDRPMVHRQALHVTQADGFVFCENVFENLPQKKKTGSRNRQPPVFS